VAAWKSAQFYAKAEHVIKFANASQTGRAASFESQLEEVFQA
jgi:hypothetical protein